MRQLSHLREKAIELRTKHGMSLDDISMRLNLPRTTVYYWIRGISIPVTNKQKASQQRGTEAMRAKYAAKRQAAYDQAKAQAEDLLADWEIRDFVVLYLAEGHRKCRNNVTFANSNPYMVQFANKCMLKLAQNEHIRYSFQYHADQDPEELQQFWGTLLEVEPARVIPVPKTNSGHLKGRRFACAYGVMSVSVGDTTFRAQLQALMDKVQEQWSPAFVPGGTLPANDSVPR